MIFLKGLHFFSPILILFSCRKFHFSIGQPATSRSFQSTSAGTYFPLPVKCPRRPTVSPAASSTPQETLRWSELPSLGDLLGPIPSPGPGNASAEETRPLEMLDCWRIAPLACWLSHEFEFGSLLWDETGLHSIPCDMRSSDCLCLLFDDLFCAIKTCNWSSPSSRGTRAEVKERPNSRRGGQSLHPEEVMNEWIRLE